MARFVPPEYDRFETFDVDAIHGGKGQTGDVCPWCGDPVQVTETLVSPAGHDVGDVGDWPTRVFHAACREREVVAIRADKNHDLEEWA